MTRTNLTLIALTVFFAGACAETDIDSVDGGSDVGIVGGTCDDVSADWDNDGIPNGDEGCVTNRDSDFDGTGDWQDFDSDNDGIPDDAETNEFGTDPFNPDTDADGYDDGVEIQAGSDPLDDFSTPEDTIISDSDGDGWPDQIEMNQGTDPNDPDSFPEGPIPGDGPPIP